MPFIIGKMCYPSHRENEAVKKFIEIASKYTADESIGKQIAAPTTTTSEGFETLNIWEPKEGKIGDVMNFLNRFYYEFKDIDGLEYEVKFWYNFTEIAAFAGIPEV
ncbi:MAG: hypothetical protein ACW98X_17485 [Promethearchaeota archaeon]|jgi:hypothetical protein